MYAVQDKLLCYTRYRYACNQKLTFFDALKTHLWTHGILFGVIENFHHAGKCTVDLPSLARTKKGRTTEYWKTPPGVRNA